MSGRIDGDPVVGAQARSGTPVDDALETFAGWCRGCHHPVPANADGRRVCPECGLDAAPVMEDARRLRAHPRAARWPAWSMIGFAAVLVMAAYAGIINEGVGLLTWFLFGWWPPTAWWVWPTRTMDLFTQSMWSCTSLVIPPLTAVLLVVCISCMRAARLVDRRILVWIGVAVIAIASAQGYNYWRLLNPITDLWNGSEFDIETALVRDVALYFVVETASLIAVTGTGLAMLRRWPVQAPPWRRRAIITLTVIVVLLHLAISLADVAVVNHFQAGHASSSPSTVIGHVGMIYFELGGL